MTREEAKIFLLQLHTDKQLNKSEHEALRIAIELLEQAPCEDAISRQAVLDGLASIAKVKAKSDAQKSLMGRVMFFVEQLPPVKPQPKTGHWIFKHNSSDIWCSCCDECYDEIPQTFNYCPNCGARMKNGGRMTYD